MADENEAQPRLSEALFLGLGLPEMMGQTLAVSTLLEELLVAALQSGAISKTQLKDSFTRATEHVGDIAADLSAPEGEDQAHRIAVADRLKQSGEQNLANMLARLTAD